MFIMQFPSLDLLIALVCCQSTWSSDPWVPHVLVATSTHLSSGKLKCLVRIRHRCVPSSGRQIMPFASLFLWNEHNWLLYKSNISFRVAQCSYFKSILFQSFVSWNSFVKRSLTPFTIQLTWAIDYTEKAGAIIDVPPYLQFHVSLGT